MIHMAKRTDSTKAPGGGKPGNPSFNAGMMGKRKIGQISTGKHAGGSDRYTKARR